MDIIVCAIRGGESSRRAQEHAIELCEQRHCSLIFVHVIDPETIKRIDSPLAETVVQEMEHIAESLLSIAVQRAITHHVTAQSALLRGSVREALENFLRETQASILVMGASETDAAYNAFDSAQLEQFIQALHTKLNVDVQVV